MIYIIFYLHFFIINFVLPFQQIVVALLNETQKMTMIISRFQEFLEIDDVRYFTMKLLLKDLKSKKSEVSISTCI